MPFNPISSASGAFRFFSPLFPVITSLIPSSSLVYALLYYVGNWCLPSGFRHTPGSLVWLVQHLWKIYNSSQNWFNSLNPDGTCYHSSKENTIFRDVGGLPLSTMSISGLLIWASEYQDTRPELVPLAKNKTRRQVKVKKLHAEEESYGRMGFWSGGMFVRTIIQLVETMWLLLTQWLAGHFLVPKTTA